MTKIIIEDVKSGYNLGKINANFVEIQRVIDHEVLMRDNTAHPNEPNQVEQDIDMNSNRILNVALPVNGGDVVTLDGMRKYVLDSTDGENYAIRAETAALNAESSENDTAIMYGNWRDDYAGNGPVFPLGENDGTLFYYDGPAFTQGLYITYASNNDPYTGNWTLVSGVGPQGPTGQEGIQGPAGVKGDQGLVGPAGIQGQQGIQGSIGDTGPAGIAGPTGDQGQQGIQGIDGPTGAVGPEGVSGAEGPIGIQGPQGIQGLVGPNGDSFTVDAVGTLVERATYDTELKGFSFLAEDSVSSAEAVPLFARYVGDGITKDYVLPFIPNGQQSLIISVDGVPQGPDNYTVAVTTSPDLYTISITTAPSLNSKVLVRAISVASGHGEIFFKNSDADADWSVGIPFGRGPRGEQGPQGLQGVQGVAGDQGAIGPDGQAGPQGVIGQTGIQGPSGAIGPQGQKGDGGDRGPDGIQGNEGPRGTVGAQGPQGNVGADGPQGPAGGVGPQGPRGDAGPKGPTGSIGPDGAEGRSSSGKSIDAPSTQWVYPDESTKEISRFDLTETKPFDRDIVVSPYLLTEHASSRNTGLLMDIRLMFNGVKVAGTTLALEEPTDKEGIFSSLIYTVPAGQKGSFSVTAYPVRTVFNPNDYIVRIKGQYQGLNSSPMGFVQLVPLSTELS